MLNPSHAFVLGLIISIISSIGMFVDNRFMTRALWTCVYWGLAFVGGMISMLAILNTVLAGW
jgi:hypothetical protein